MDIRLGLLEQERIAEGKSLDAKTNAIKQNINDNIKDEKTRFELLAEATTESKEELKAIDDFYAQEKIASDARTQETIRNNQVKTAQQFVQIGQASLNAVSSAVTAYGDYRLSQLEKGTEEYDKEARKQFGIQKKLNVANTIMSGAAAIIGTWQGYASLGIPGTVLAVAQSVAITANTAAQVVKIKGQQYQGFETGVIVPGNSFSGDNVPISTNSGEAVLTAAQQAEFMNIANGQGSSGGGSISLTIMMDGSQIYSGLVDATADGRAQVDMRGLVEN